MGISLRKTDVPVVESSNSGIHGPRNRYLVLKMLGTLLLYYIQHTFFCDVNIPESASILKIVIQIFNFT